MTVVERVRIVLLKSAVISRELRADTTVVTTKTLKYVVTIEVLAVTRGMIACHSLVVVNQDRGIVVQVSATTQKLQSAARMDACVTKVGTAWKAGVVSQGRSLVARTSATMPTRLFAVPMERFLGLALRVKSVATCQILVMTLTQRLAVCLGLVQSRRAPALTE